MGHVLRGLPDDLGAPGVVVQHAPSTFTALLVETLGRKCPLHVVAARDGDYIEPGGVWVCPGDWHMTLQPEGRWGRICLSQTEPVHFCRPSLDVLFRSVAAAFEADALGVVLTGMGKDGLAGSRAIRDAGGAVIVQDEASSTIWGMPGQVARAGLAEEILPPDGLSTAIVNRSGRRAPRARVAS